MQPGPDTSVPSDASGDASPDAAIPPGTPTWVQHFGDSGDDAGESVLVHSDGTIVAAGTFTGAMDVGTTLTSAGAADLFVIRRQGDGTAIGAVRYGSSGIDLGPLLASLPGRGVAIGATFKGVTDLGNHTSNGGQPEATDGVVGGLTASFARVWSQHVSSFYVETVNSVAADSSGNVIAGGHFAFSVTLGTTTLVGEGFDGYVVRFDPSGAVTWATGVGGSAGGNQFVTSVATDDAGNVYAAGFFEGTASIVGGDHTSLGAYDVFVVKLDSAGTVLWRRVYGGTMDDRDPTITVDSARNVYLSAQFTGTASFGGPQLTASGDVSDNAVLVKLDASGGFVWQARVPGRVTSMQASTDGIHVVGAVSGTADLGDGITVTSAGGTDALVARLGVTGTWAWARVFGGPLDDRASDIAIASDGGDVITGTFRGAAMFGDVMATSAGMGDVFLIRLAP